MRQQNFFKFLAFIGLILFVTSCGNDPIPKPKGFLRLEYPEANYKKEDLDLPFSFEKNKLASTIGVKKLRGTKNSFGVNIEYPKLKGTIYLTYKAVSNNEALINYLRDAQNFTQEHTKKADEITGRPYINETQKAYGMFYEVGGNAASQSQFYVTDSINHFLTGSLYFDATPNYDSILPAANYLQQDIRRIMESVSWK